MKHTGEMTRLKLSFLPVLACALAAMFAFAPSAGAGTYTWNTPSGNWSTPADWNPATPLNGPQATDTVVFANSDESASPFTVNNTVDIGFGIATLNYTDFEPSAGPYVYPVTFIPANQTLLVTNSLLVGGNIGNSGSAGQATYAYVFGGGTLKVTGPNFLVADCSSSSGAGMPCAYFNLSGLTNFIYNNPNGTFGIATNGGILAGDTRVGGAMAFAYSNNITVGTMNLSTPSTAAQQGGPGLLTESYANFGTEPNGVQNNDGPLPSGIPEELVLGPGTNIINARAINIAADKNGFIVTNSGGGLRIRGVTGAASDANVNITVGIRNPGGGSGQTTGWLLLNGCPVDIKANSLILGDHLADTPSGAAGGNALLEFDTGTISANSLLMADNVANNNNANTAVATGLIEVGAHAMFSIGAGQLFALATASGTGPAVGFLVVSNGVINCQGPIVMGVNTNSVPSSSAGFATGIIQLIGSGTLDMGPNSYIGTATNPITGLLLDTNSVFSLSIPSASYTNVCVNNLAWPSPDTNLTLSVAAIPAGVTNGEVFPFISYNTLTNSIIVSVPGYISFTNNNATSGAFNNPKVVLPIGATGYMFSSNNNVIYLTLTSGTGLGYGGVPLLTNGFFIQGATDWTASGSGASIVSTNSTYPNTGGCTVDTRNIVPMPGTGTNVAKLTGSFVTGGSTNVWSQTVPVTAGSQVTIGASTYVAHEDIMSGADSFYYEVDFLDGNNNLVGAYESGVLTNLNCSSPVLDTWDLMAVTNEMQVTGGINTGVVLASFTNALVQVPAGSVTAQFKAVFIQRNATDAGSVYFSGANIGFLLGPVPPAVSSISPNLVTLCTNQFLSCTVTSAITTISSFQVTATTTTLAGASNNTTTYNLGSPALTVTGLGTSSATVSLALATNTIYQSVVVTATDADNLAVSSSPVSLDTLTPVLVIEAGDFNYSSGQFIDTPQNGGFALYQGKVGNQGIDENKISRTGGTQSYYRPTDSTIVQAAGSTSGTEQKFVTAAANGDSTDIEVAIGNDSVGDWQNYSRTFGTSGTYSAQPGTYNVWCYLATSGSGPQVGFYQVTGNPDATGQSTNLIGSFGGSTFSDNSFFNYVYAPLEDQFGNRATLTISNGVQTFRGQIINSDTPNVAFYMLTPVVPVLTPIYLYVNPSASFEPTNEFTFVVGPAQGAAIATNGIGVTLNGVPVTSGLTFTPYGSGGWTVTFPIQSNQVYSIVLGVTNLNGLSTAYTNSIATFNLNNFHWMAADYDFSTNNGTATGGSVGDGWTGGLFINNPVPTGDTGAPLDDQTYQFSTNSYFGYPSGFYPGIDPSGNGAVAQESIDINWFTNTTQDPGLVITNSIYRLSPNPSYGDGVGTQVASDSFLMPEFAAGQTNALYGRDGSSGGPDSTICEFNIGYFYTNDWLNYTRNYPAGTFNVWGRLAAGGGAFSGCTLSLVTSGVGTSNQTTQVLGSFSDPNPAGWQAYHWIELSDTNGNPVYLTLNGQATLRLTAPPNATPNGNALNPLFFMLAPASAPALPFKIAASLSGNNIEISIPTQSGHSYTLWHAATVNGAWTQVGSAITGNGSVQTIPEPASSSQGYYKVTTQ